MQLSRSPAQHSALRRTAGPYISARGRPPSLEHQPGRLSRGTAEAVGHIVGQTAAAGVDPIWSFIKCACRNAALPGPT